MGNILKKLVKWSAIAFGCCIVVALALVVVTYPHSPFRPARGPMNEALVARTPRNIVELETQYWELHSGTYSRSLKELSGFRNDQSGYVIVYAPSAADAEGKIAHFAVTALPRVPGETGVRYFYGDESGVLRWETMKPADGKSRALN